MSDYIFRGQSISGFHAYALLDAIKRVLAEAPNPTQEDIAMLEEIVKDFGEKFCVSLQQEYENSSDDDDLDF